MIQVTEFQPTDVCGEVENTFKEWEETADEKGGDHRHEKGRAAAGTQKLQVIHGIRPDGGSDARFSKNEAESHGDTAGVDARPQQLPAFSHLVRQQDRRHAGDEAEDHVIQKLRPRHK